MTTPQNHRVIEAVEVIQKLAGDFQPKLGIILGSGMGYIADNIHNPVRLSFQDIPGMKKCSVEGHCGVLHLGYIHDVPVACFQGRNHVYEGHAAEVVQAPLHILKLLGAEMVLLVSAVGSLNPDIEAGSLVCISDHINFLFSNPLVGPNDDFWGPRFPNMENAYDNELRQQLQQIAQQENIPLHTGIYIGVLGPSFETPAEIRAFRLLGADVIGMSTVPEVITARHCGLKVATLAIATNIAAGLSEHHIDHQLSLETAKNSAHDLSRLILKFIEQIK